MGPYATEFSFLSLCFLIGKVTLASRCGADEDNGDKVLDRGSGKEEEVSSGQWTCLERPLGPSQDCLFTVVDVWFGPWSVAFSNRTTHMLVF